MLSRPCFNIENPVSVLYHPWVRATPTIGWHVQGPVCSQNPTVTCTLLGFEKATGRNRRMGWLFAGRRGPRHQQMLLDLCARSLRIRRCNPDDPSQRAAGQLTDRTRVSGTETSTCGWESNPEYADLCMSPNLCLCDAVATVSCSGWGRGGKGELPNRGARVSSGLPSASRPTTSPKRRTAQARRWRRPSIAAPGRRTSRATARDSTPCPKGRPPSSSAPLAM